ncbi:hypothetical protein GCM10007415_11740 [Parapedobacter pyrenivorans]|uniref:CHAT domain-containing protein n=2 Tax=Parapedobacter pyrenivorans TaxID=1305674 RepID=A0A917HJQ5_9SPHI|nr:hypothetical protein GCM10007415_11740 [Parapedobacter pyrenivorans]
MLAFTTESQESNWKALSIIADSLQSNRQFDQAVPFWEQAVSSAKNAPDTIKRMLRFRLLYGKGLTYDYEKEGIPFFEEAYPLLSVSQLDTSRQSTFLNTYYHYLGYNGRWTEALPIAELCMRLRENLDEKPPLAYISTVHDVAYINNMIGHYPQAIEGYKRSIDLYIRHKGRFDNDVALGYNNLAFNYGLMGMANKQYESYSEAAAIWESIALEDKSYLSTVYGNLLQWLIDYGQVDEAESLLAKMRQLHLHKDAQWGSNNRLIVNKNELENVNIRLSLWNKSIKLYAKTGDTARTHQYLDSIARVLHAIGPQRTDKQLEYLESGYADIGSAYAAQGKDSFAVSYFQKALDLKRTHQYGRSQSQTLAKMAKSLMAIRDFETAKLYIDSTLAITKHSANLPVFHTIAAQIAAKQQDTDRARYHIAQTLEGLAGSATLGKSPQKIKSGDFDGKVDRNYIAALSSAGHHYLGFYRNTGQVSDLDAAQHLFTLASDMLGTYYLGGLYTETLAELLSAIQQGLLECQLLNPNEAIKEQTLARLISLVENSQSRHSWKKFLKNMPTGSLVIPDSLLDQEEAHRRLIVHYKSQLYGMANDSAIHGDTDLITALLHQEEAALQKAETAILNLHPIYNHFSESQITTSDIQQKLRNQSILRYVITDSASYLIHIKRRSLALYPLGNSSTLIGLAERTIGLLKKRDDAYYPAAKELHDLLLPETLKPHLANQLIIVPDGVLHYLPFEALTANGEPSGFLVHNHTPSYATSLPLLLVQDQTSYSNERAFAAFAPHYPVTTTAADQRGQELLDLPGAANEVDVLSTLFGGDIHRGDSVIKSVFWDQAPKYGLLHLAMHAQVDDHNGEQSHFIFADNSRLHSYELYGMKLQAGLAVLSACNTGYGPIQKGEGVQSLARAFTYAGVPSLVMGLWQLPDNSTSEIMVDFYHSLKENKHKHVALATAKKGYLEKFELESELLHPYYWAGLVISGNTSSIRPGINWLYWALLGIIGFGGCLYAGRKWKRARRPRAL